MQTVVTKTDSKYLRKALNNYPPMSKEQCQGIIDDMVAMGYFLSVSVDSGRVFAIDPHGKFEWRICSEREWQETKSTILQVYGLPKKKHQTEIIQKKRFESDGEWVEGEPRIQQLDGKNAGTYQKDEHSPLIFISSNTIIGYRRPEDDEVQWTEQGKTYFDAHKLKFFMRHRNFFRDSYGMGEVVKRADFIERLIKLGLDPRDNMAPCNFIGMKGRLYSNQ